MYGRIFSAYTDSVDLIILRKVWLTMKKIISFALILTMLFSALSFTVNAENDFVYGDVNADEKVNIRDATEIQRYVARLITLEENQLFAADFDGNSYISINDCTTLQKQLVELSVEVERKTIPVVSGKTPEETGTAIDFNVDKNKNDHSKHSYSYGSAGGYDEYTAVISTYEEYAQIIENPCPEYDEEFFKENSLIFLFRWTSSGSYRYSINSLSLKDKTLYMEVDLNIPDGAVTDDIGNWNIYVSVKKSDIAKAEKLYIF